MGGEGARRSRLEKGPFALALRGRLGRERGAGSGGGRLSAVVRGVVGVVCDGSCWEVVA